MLYAAVISVHSALLKNGLSDEVISALFYYYVAYFCVYLFYIRI